MELLSFLKEVKGVSAGPKKEWPVMLDEVPHVSDLDLPAGSLVFVRGDLDSGKKLDEDKLGSQEATLNHCVKKGWKVILTGHRNRPTETEQKAFHSGGGDIGLFLFEPEIKAYLEKLVGKPFLYVRNWLTPDGSAFTDDFFATLGKMNDGDILLLENERMWDLLWNTLWQAEDESALKALVPAYHCLGAELSGAGVVAHINDAASDAKNVNFSTVAILPFMQHGALGFHFKEDLRKIKEARRAKLVCFSGAKLDKVKKMKKIIKRGFIETVITGGLVSLPLIAAKAKLSGQKPAVGAVGEPEQQTRNRELYVSPEIIDEAVEIYKMIEEKGIKVTMLTPVDWKLEDGTITEDEKIPDGKSAWDIGPKSMANISEAVSQYIEAHKSEAKDYPIFLNGFLGRMEMPDFAAGTKSWGADVGRLAASGFKVIAGGGEGRQVYAGAEVIVSGGTTIQGMGTGDIPALTATWLFNQAS